MKKMFKTAALLSVAAFCATLPVMGGQIGVLQVHVPFAFVAGGQEFAPGTYIIHEQANGLLIISSARQAGVVLSFPRDTVKTSTPSSLGFQSHGGREYLVTVQSQDAPSRGLAIPFSAEHSVSIAKQ